MNIYSSSTYLSDLKAVTESLDLSPMHGKKILITGATGLICSAIVDLLLFANKTQALDVTVYAAARTPEKLSSRFPDMKTYGLVPVKYDATKAFSFDGDLDFVIHGASNASPDKYISEPVDTLLANIVGIHNLLECTRASNLKKFVYISSSEVYGKLPSEAPLVENEYGITDILSARSAYPIGKQAAEALCIAYANQYGTDVSIVRPGHIYGPTAQLSDNRISSAFVRQALAKEDIVLKSSGTQIRSYCHCLDCASAILCVLMHGESKQAYNISNSDSIITIRQMAALIARFAEVSLIFDLPTEADSAAFNPMNNSSLNSDKLYSLGWRGVFDAETGFSHTISVLRESSNS